MVGTDRTDLRVLIMHRGLPWPREAIEPMRMYPQVDRAWRR